MPKAGAKTTTNAKPDQSLRDQEIEATCHAVACDEALVAANARVDAICDEMVSVYQQILRLTPVTPEGQRALALAIAQKCAVTNELSTPETEFECGVAVLFSALGVDQRAA